MKVKEKKPKLADAKAQEVPDDKPKKKRAKPVEKLIMSKDTSELTNLTKVLTKFFCTVQKTTLLDNVPLAHVQFRDHQ